MEVITFSLISGVAVQVFCLLSYIFYRHYKSISIPTANVEVKMKHPTKTELKKAKQIQKKTKKKPKPTNPDEDDIPEMQSNSTEDQLAKIILQEHHSQFSINTTAVNERPKVGKHPTFKASKVTSKNVSVSKGFVLEEGGEWASVFNRRQKQKIEVTTISENVFKFILDSEGGTVEVPFCEIHFPADSLMNPLEVRIELEMERYKKFVDESGEKILVTPILRLVSNGNPHLERSFTLKLNTMKIMGRGWDGGVCGQIETSDNGESWTTLGRAEYKFGQPMQVVHDTLTGFRVVVTRTQNGVITRHLNIAAYIAKPKTLDPNFHTVHLCVYDQTPQTGSRVEFGMQKNILKMPARECDVPFGSDLHFKIPGSQKFTTEDKEIFMRWSEICKANVFVKFQIRLTKKDMENPNFEAEYRTIVFINISKVNGNAKSVQQEYFHFYWVSANIFPKRGPKIRRAIKKEDENSGKISEDDGFASGTELQNSDSEKNGKIIGKRIKSGQTNKMKNDKEHLNQSSQKQNNLFKGRRNPVPNHLLKDDTRHLAPSGPINRQKQLPKLKQSQEVKKPRGPPGSWEKRTPQPRNREYQSKSDESLSKSKPNLQVQDRPARKKQERRKSSRDENHPNQEAGSKTDRGLSQSNQLPKPQPKDDQGQQKRQDRRLISKDENPPHRQAGLKTEDRFSKSVQKPKPQTNDPVQQNKRIGENPLHQEARLKTDEGFSKSSQKAKPQPNEYPVHQKKQTSENPPHQEVRMKTDEGFSKSSQKAKPQPKDHPVQQKRQTSENPRHQEARMKTEEGFSKFSQKAKIQPKDHPVQQKKQTSENPLQKVIHPSKELRHPPVEKRHLSKEVKKLQKRNETEEHRQHPSQGRRNQEPRSNDHPHRENRNDKRYPPQRPRREGDERYPAAEKGTGGHPPPAQQGRQELRSKVQKPAVAENMNPGYRDRPNPAQQKRIGAPPPRERQHPFQQRQKDAGHPTQAKQQPGKEMRQPDQQMRKDEFLQEPSNKAEKRRVGGYPGQNRTHPNDQQHPRQDGGKPESPTKNHIETKHSSTIGGYQKQVRKPTQMQSHTRQPIKPQVDPGASGDGAYPQKGGSPTRQKPRERKLPQNFKNSVPEYDNFNAEKIVSMTFERAKPTDPLLTSEFKVQNSKPPTTRTSANSPQKSYENDEKCINDTKTASNNEQTKEKIFSNNSVSSNDQMKPLEGNNNKLENSLGGDEHFKADALTPAPPRERRNKKRRRIVPDETVNQPAQENAVQ